MYEALYYQVKGIKEKSRLRQSMTWNKQRMIYSYFS